MCRGKEVNTENIEMFVYKELEILAAEDTKSFGGKGWMEARPLVERVPLMYWIEERRKKRTSYI